MTCGGVAWRPPTCTPGRTARRCAWGRTSRTPTLPPPTRSPATAGGARTPRPGSSAGWRSAPAVRSRPRCSGGSPRGWPTTATRHAAAGGLTPPGLSAVTCGPGSRPSTRGARAPGAVACCWARGRARALGASVLHRQGCLARVRSRSPLAHAPARTRDHASVPTTMVNSSPHWHTKSRDYALVEVLGLFVHSIYTLRSARVR